MKTRFKITCKRGVAVIDTETGWIENYDALYYAIEDCFNYWLHKEATAAVFQAYSSCPVAAGDEKQCNWHGAVEIAIDAIAEHCQKRQADITTGAFLEIGVASYLGKEPCAGCQPQQGPE